MYPDWPQTHYEAEDFKILILLPPPSARITDMCHNAGFMFAGVLNPRLHAC